jgi:hypothetical protein
MYFVLYERGCFVMVLASIFIHESAGSTRKFDIDLVLTIKVQAQQTDLFLILY